MASAKKKTAMHPEVEALTSVIALLSPLEDKHRTWVVTSAISNLEIAMTVPGGGGATGRNSGGGGGGGVGTAPLRGEAGSNEHAKAFLRDKKPKSTLQRIAVLAYYLTMFRGTHEFKTKDISVMNSDAGGTRIGNPAQSVNDATHKSGFLAPAGRGRKRLTNHGEDVVDALPDQEAVKAVEKNKPRQRRKPKAKRKQ